MDWYITISMFSVIIGARGKTFIFLTSEGTWNATRNECSKYNGRLFTDELNETPNVCIEDMLAKTPSVWTGAHTQLTPYLSHKGCFEYYASAVDFQRMHPSSVGQCYQLCKDSDGFGIRNATDCACIRKNQILSDAKSSYENCLSHCSLFPDDRREYCGGEHTISLYMKQDGHDPDEGEGYTFKETIHSCALLNRYVGLPPNDCQYLQEYHYWVDIYRYQIPILTEAGYAKSYGEEFQCGLLRNKSIVPSNCTLRHPGLCVTKRLISGKMECETNIDVEQETDGTPEGSSYLSTTTHPCAEPLCFSTLESVTHSFTVKTTSSGIQNERPSGQEKRTSDSSYQTAIAAGLSILIVVLIVIPILGVGAYRRRVCNGVKAPDVNKEHPAPPIEENYFVLEQKTTHNDNLKTGAIPKHHKTSKIPKGYEDIYVEHDEGEYDELNKARGKIQNNTEDPGIYMHGNVNEGTDDGVYNFPSRVKITQEEDDYSRIEGNTNYGHGNYGMVVEDTRHDDDTTYDHC